MVVSHLIILPPMHPGRRVRSGAPWSGVSHSPFCLKASNTSRSRSKAQPMSMEVPYSPVSPFGNSPTGPSKWTYRCSLLGFVMPSDARKSHKRTPVQMLLPTAAAPQLKPTVFLHMFCSMRRFPAQMKVTGKLTTGPNLPSVKSCTRKLLARAMAKFLSLISCVSRLSCGTAPWFRTTCKAGGVIQPAACNLYKGGSELKGCLPVRRSMHSFRLTHSSGVPTSRASTSVASCRGGITKLVSHSLVERDMAPFSSIVPSFWVKTRSTGETCLDKEPIA
mmetsp:Transcript_8023/g.18745  ORF Transcript_8023/g.18745 Transcript_8023/m.18745 type:complete len:277 (+) Transcript_8023:2128-2958(+)